MQRIDANALRDLVDSYGAALKLYARQWCNAPDDALQEALIDLLRQNPVPDQPVAWLFNTIRCRALNLTRGERRRSEHYRQASQERDEWFSDNDGLGFDNEEVTAALAGLSELEREVVIARIWGELSFEKIGELVDISSSSAHRRYHAALLQLYEVLEGKDSTSGLNNESKTRTSHRCDV